MSQPTPLTPPSPAGPGREDTGSLALTEALRSIFLVLKLVMVGVLIVFVFSGVFIVESNQVAVVQRFGKPVGQGGQAVKRPGLHFAFPYPVDEIVRIPVGESHSASSSTGWYNVPPEMAARGEEPPATDDMVPGVDGYLLTADGNIIHARATLKYRIVDPVRHAFAFAHATATLRNALNRALIHASSRFTADDAIYRNKIAYKEAVQEHLDELLVSQPLGIEREQFDVQVVAPLSVRGAFESVLAAELERSKRVNDAQGEARVIVQRAAGEANSVISAGLTVSNQLVLSISADARSFEDQYPHFLKNPELFQRRVMAETLRLVLAQAQDTFFLPRREDGSSRELRLQLNRAPAKVSPGGSK